MDYLIEQMLAHRNAGTLADKKNSMKEIMQEIVLCGLSRAGFFKTAAFYGGTVLRIFHGLDRFSEDLDFSLKSAQTGFDFTVYLPALEKEIRSYGLNFRVEQKEKTYDSDVKSAFLKGNTREHMLLFYADDGGARSISANEVIKVKLEVDVNPPEFAHFEHKYQLLPIPYEIALYDMPSLFAGKIHAVLCRAWNNRTKGRDLYDYVYFLANRTAVNLPHLMARLAQTKCAENANALNLSDIRRLLCDRFSSIDYKQARQDVSPFIRNQNALDVWSTDFFMQITENLREEQQ